MEGNDIPKLRRDLALEMATGKVNATLRKLKSMPISQLEALSVAEMKGAIDIGKLDAKGKKELKIGLEKLNFYVCGILMHRILEGE